MKIDLFSNPSIQSRIKKFRFNSAVSDKPYSTLYEISDALNKKIGSFTFFDNGYVESLQINEKMRGTKNSIAALFAIKDFVIQKAKMMNLDFVEFVALKDNKYHVAKTYEKMGAIPVYNKSAHCIAFAIPVCEKMENHFSMQKFNVDNLKKIIAENLKSF